MERLRQNNNEILVKPFPFKIAMAVGSSPAVLARAANVWLPPVDLNWKFGEKQFDFFNWKFWFFDFFNWTFF